jgi:hypothetical protein
MEFILLTPERNYQVQNVSRVKGHLKNGIVEVFDKHQFLMGLIENNLIEIETIGENELKKFFVLQDGIFIVSETNLGSLKSKTPTTVYAYAKTFFEIKKGTSIEELSKNYEEKKQELDQEILKLNIEGNESINYLLNAKALLLKQEVEFFRSIIKIYEKVNSSSI